MYQRKDDELKKKYEHIKLNEDFGELKFYRNVNTGEPIISNGHEIQGWSITQARDLYQSLADFFYWHDAKLLNDDSGYVDMIRDYGVDDYA
ncbi:hypothetical protein SEA_LILYPAD_85 [Gordonia phage LilyPad]|nr:hypothetical protein SEA_LILYPAD_85 [Gordonia phage LilyPad]